MGTIMTIITIIIAFLGIRFILRHFKGILKLVLILALLLLALSLIFDPEARTALGWFLFAAICGTLGFGMLWLLKNL